MHIDITCDRLVAAADENGKTVARIRRLFVWAEEETGYMRLPHQ